MQTTLVASMLFSTVAGVLYAYVGFRLLGRDMPIEARGAHRAFLAWWFALALTSLLSASVLALYGAGILPLWLFQTMAQAQVLLTMVAFAGLTSYLTFLYTGSDRLIAWIVAYFVGLYLFLEALMFQGAPPSGLADNGWTVATVPSAGTSSVLLAVYVVMLLGPQIVACIAYAGLYPKAQTPTQRYRIALVSSSILVWSGYSLAATLSPQVGATWQLLLRVLALAAAVAILMAYIPPTGWKARYNLRSIRDEGASG